MAARLRDDDKIGILINNAGAALAGGFDSQSWADVEGLIAVNTSAVVRLAHAASRRALGRGRPRRDH
ncbi:hypothetical protein ACRAWD_27730 [Caulobacter segnis]